MQYPVPQFTDVEDKIIGALTVKQFGIIFVAGVIIFIPYTIAKSMTVLIFMAIVVGIPALAVAFAKINGRPMYKMFPYVMKFITTPKYLVFHKEAGYFTGSEKIKNVEIQQQVAPSPVSRETTEQRLKEVNRLLEQQAREQETLIHELK